MLQSIPLVFPSPTGCHLKEENKCPMSRIDLQDGSSELALPVSFFTFAVKLDERLFSIMSVCVFVCQLVSQQYHDKTYSLQPHKTSSTCLPTLRLYSTKLLKIRKISSSLMVFPLDGMLGATFSVPNTILYGFFKNLQLSKRTTNLHKIANMVFYPKFLLHYYLYRSKVTIRKKNAHIGGNAGGTCTLLSAILVFSWLS